MGNKLSVFGKMRSGKDTVAKILSEYGIYELLAFGDPLKEYYHEVFDVITDERKHDRGGYQYFGQAMRAIHPDIWIEHIKREIELIGDNPFNEQLEGFIFTDMRQPNEYEYLKSEGYTMIKVYTPLHIRKQRMKDAGEEVDVSYLEHETEQNIDEYDYDYLIVNDGDMTQLRQQVDAVAREVFGNA